MKSEARLGDSAATMQGTLGGGTDTGGTDTAHHDTGGTHHGYGDRAS